MFVCSDTDFCAGRRAAGHEGAALGARTGGRGMTLMENDDRHRPAASEGRRPDQTLRPPHRLRGRVSFDLYPGEVLGIVGESGSGKSTLLSCLAGHQRADLGRIAYDGRDVLAMSETERRRLGRTDWAYVHQNPRDGLRMGGQRGRQRRRTADGRRRAALWRDPRQGGRLAGPGRDRRRPDRRPPLGLFRRHAAAPADRAQPGDRARALCSWTNRPGGLDVSVQARLLDLLRGLVRDLGLSASSS